MAKDSVLSTTIPLPSNRRFLFSKEVTAESISELSERILEVNEEDEFLTKLYHIHELTYIRKPLKIFLDSPGGFVYCCFGLLSIMDKSKTPIHTIATGAAMSCGFLILIHGHRRFAYEHATPMYHQVMGGAIGKISDMEEDVIETKRLHDKIEEMTLAKTKIPKKKLQKIYKTKKDWFMTVKEAEKYGVIDEVI